MEQQEIWSLWNMMPTRWNKVSNNLYAPFSNRCKTGRYCKCRTADWCFWQYGTKLGPHLHFETKVLKQNGEWQRFNPELYLAELEVREAMPVALDKNGKNLYTWQKLAHLCLWEAVRQEVNYSKTKT